MHKQIGNLSSRQRWVALFAVVWCRTIILPGCGSSTGDVQGTAKAKSEEERWREEGTGKNKQKVLIRRRDERQKELLEAAKKNPGG